MSWHFSRELVAGYLGEKSSGGELFVLSNTNHMPLLYSSSDKMMDFCQRSPSGMTCEPLTEDLGRELLTWFLEDSLAKTSAQQVKEQDSTGNALDSGAKWPGSLAKYDHDSHSWKTHQCLLLGGCAEFSETWPRWGLMLDGECWALTPPGEFTKEIGSGSLPTPRKQIQNRPCRTREDYHSNLEEYLGNRYPFLCGQLCDPDYAEWVMGWPIGWTDLVPQETDKFHLWQHSHSGF